MSTWISVFSTFWYVLTWAVVNMSVGSSICSRCGNQYHNISNLYSFSFSSLFWLANTNLFWSYNPRGIRRNQWNVLNCWNANWWFRNFVSECFEHLDHFTNTKRAQFLNMKKKKKKKMAQASTYLCLSLKLRIELSMSSSASCSSCIFVWRVAKKLDLDSHSRRSLEQAAKIPRLGRCIKDSLAI